MWQQCVQPRRQAATGATAWSNFIHQAQRDAEAAAVRTRLFDRLKRGRGVAFGHARGTRLDLCEADRAQPGQGTLPPGQLGR